MKRLSTVLVPLLAIACENPAFHDLPEIEPPTDNGGNDDEAPTFSAVTVEPEVAADGVLVTLSFEVSEDLPTNARTPDNNPEVTVDGRPMDCAPNGLVYSCAREVDATVDTEGTKQFAITAMDSAGNEATDVDPGVNVVYDFTPPVLSVTADPTRVAPGGTVMFTITADEPLAGAPTLNTTFLSSVSNCPSFDNNYTFHCEGTVDTGATLGAAVVTATGTDVAGNRSTSPPMAITISDQPPDTYAVGGTVSGMVGTGLVLQNNGGDDLAISADGPFSFATALEDAEAYDVTILVQPTSPDQNCTVTNGSGTIAGADVTDVSISCSTDTFPVGVTVSGLAGSGLVLQNNGGDDLSIPSDGSYAFATEIADGSDFDVSVLTQPTAPTQTCAITGGSGTIAGAPVTVAVTCSTGAFNVGGDVSGLVGSGLVLQLNGSENLSISADGSFAFTTLLPDLFAYTVTVLTQPTAPAQTCTLANDTGAISGAHVTDVTVTCTTETFTVGGNVIGLTGTGLTLQNNGADTLSIVADGAFVFATPLADLSTYDVTISNQPTAQTCSISAGTGAISGGNVTSVVVNCQTGTYTIGGTVNGLSPSGTGVVLQNNNGDDLLVTSPGPFTFSTPLATTTSYSVTVLTQPTSPNQTCTVTSGGFGAVNDANVTDVVIDCVTTTYSVGGTVSGFAGGILVLQNNGGDDRNILSNGGFLFTTRIDDGAPYSVTVLTQPTTPHQTCTITNSSGTINGADVSDVEVTCTVDQFTIGGSVSGLTGTGLVLQNNGGDDESIAANGPYTFDTALDDMDGYTVTVSQQPTNPSQNCTVSNHFGSIAGADVTNVDISCSTNQYVVGGTVSGLAPGNSVVLRNNGGDDETVSLNGGFTFDTALNDGAIYSVTVYTQPTTPNQTCTVANESGTINGADVTNVTVTCTTSTYSVGGAVTGLNGTVVLRNNGMDDLAITADGPFTFSTELADGAAYTVSIAFQPTSPNQTCSLTNESGTIAGADVNDVIVTCVTEQYTVGGNVSGLTGTGLVLLNNGGDDLPLVSNGPFTFSTPLDDGSDYDVTGGTQPTGQTCTVTFGIGTIGGTDVTGVAVSCIDAVYTVGGTVSGLLGTVILQNNGGDDLLIGINGPYTFPTALADGTDYDVTVSFQPDSPRQTCVPSNNTGTIAGDHVDNVDVVCTTDQFTVQVTVSGLVGSGLVLQNNGGDNLPISADGAHTFSTPLDDGATYDVSILTQPTSPNQACSVANGYGTITGADITNVTVNCAAAQYTVGGTVSGLFGSGLQLHNNGGDALSMSTDGPFVFSTSLSDGADYDVTVSAQPVLPPQICTVSNGSGTIASANVTNVSVTCVSDPPPDITASPPVGSPIPNTQEIVFTFSEEVDPATLVIVEPAGTDMLAAGYTQAWSNGNTVLTFAPTGTWASGVLQMITFHVEDLAGVVAEGVALYDVNDPASVIHVDGGSGSDTGSCGPVGSPCLTISHGLSRAYADGEEAVYVMAGTYDETRLCNGTWVAVVMPPDVRLYGGFTTGFAVADRDPETHVTTIQSNNSTDNPPPVQIIPYDDQCDGNPVSPNQSTVLDGFLLQNLTAATAFYANATGTIRGSEIQGDVVVQNLNPIVGFNRIIGHVSAGGAAMVLWNDITAPGTVVTVTDGTVFVEGNLILGTGSTATGVHVVIGGADSEITDNEIDLSGATRGLYGVNDETNSSWIDDNTITGIHGDAGGGRGIHGGFYVAWNYIVLDGSDGDLYGIETADTCQSNTIIAGPASGTAYGIQGCWEAFSNIIRKSESGDAFDWGIDGSTDVSFNNITLDNGTAIRTLNSPVSVTNNDLNLSGGVGITFGSSPVTYAVNANVINDPSLAIELLSGDGDITGNDMVDCQSTCISNSAGATGSMNIDNNFMTLLTNATAIEQTNAAATMSVFVTGNEITGGDVGVLVTATNTGHIVRDNLILLDRTGSTMTNGGYGIQFSEQAGGVIEDNVIGYPQVGIWLADNPDSTIVRNNLVTGRWGIVISNTTAGGSDVHDLQNNTVVGRVGVYLDGNLDVDILNTIIAGADTAEHGIFVNATTATPTLVANNDIYDFPAVYRSANGSECTVGNDCTLAEMEAAASLTASGNVEVDPVFALFGGADGDPSTNPFLEGDSYQLVPGGPCEVRQGGRDGSAWGYDDDLLGFSRTTSTACGPSNADAGGWSMGAFERD